MFLSGGHRLFRRLLSGIHLPSGMCFLQKMSGSWFMQNTEFRVPGSPLMASKLSTGNLCWHTRGSCMPQDCRTTPFLVSSDWEWLGSKSQVRDVQERGG